MNYRKPEIFCLGQAPALIQGQKQSFSESVGSMDQLKVADSELDD